MLLAIQQWVWLLFHIAQFPTLLSVLRFHTSLFGGHCTGDQDSVLAEMGHHALFPASLLIIVCQVKFDRNVLFGLAQVTQQLSVTENAELGKNAIEDSFARVGYHQDAEYAINEQIK